MFLFLQLLLIDLFRGEGSPCVKNVRQDEGDQQRDITHGRKGVMARRAVLNGQRVLQVEGGRIEGSIVIPGNQEEGEDGQYRANPGTPYPLVAALLKTETGSENP